MVAKNSPYAHFSTDTSLEKKGITLDFGDFAIRVARAGGANKKYAKALHTKMKPHRKAFQAGTLDPKVGNNIMAEVYAETIVLGWAGVVDAEGAEMEFNKENCVKLFTDLPELFNQVIADAENYRLFKEEEEEDIAKN